MAKISTFGMNAAFQLGFKRIADVRGITSVVSLFKNSMILSGLYLQIRPNRVAYIGKTNNMPARFEQHLARGVVIEELAFMPVLAKYIDEKEKELILLSEKKGIPIENIALREKKSPRDKNLGDLFTEEVIHEWLNDDRSYGANNLWLQTYNQMHPGLKHQFDLARSHPAWAQIFPVAKSFVRHIILKPELTYDDFWSAAAYNRRSEENFMSVIRIHAGSLTLLNLGAYREAPFEPWGWIDCQKDELFNAGFTENRLRADFPFICITEKGNYFELSTSARLLPIIIERLRKPLRKTTFHAMQNALLQRGNPALEHLLFSH